MKNYRVIVASSPVDLEVLITKFVKENWSLVGGVSIAVVFDDISRKQGLTFAQAIAK